MYLYNGICYIACPTSTVAQNISLTCTPCSVNCITCTSSTFCLVCAQGYSVWNGICVQSCPIGTYSQDTKNGTICQNCADPKCTNCSLTACFNCQLPFLPNGLSCTNCIAGYFYSNNNAC